MDRAQLVVVMAKGDGVGRTVRPYGVKSNDDLAAALGPTAPLRGVVFPDIKSSEARRAIRCQIQGKDPARRICFRRVALVGPGKIIFVQPDKTGGAQNGCRPWGRLCAGGPGGEQPAQDQGIS